MKAAGRRSKGRFKLVHRLGSRRRVSTSEAGSTRAKDDLILSQQQEQVHVDETASIDVLGRESIVSSDSENLGACESFVEETEEQEVLAIEPIASQAQQAEPDLSASIQTWLHDVDALVHSPEMSAVMSSSIAITTIAAKTALHVAALPMTVPLHIASSATGMVVGTCTHVLGSVCSIAERAIHAPTGGQSSMETDNPVEGLIRNLTGMIPFVFHVAGKIKDDIGSNILGLVSPAALEASQQQQAPRSPQRRAGESSAEKQDFLDRLRLDYPPSPTKSTKQVASSTSSSCKVALPDTCSKVALPPSKAEQTTLQESPRSPDVSKFLLRVCDLGMSFRGDEADRSQKVYHIDLSKDYANPQLTQQAIDALVENGLALLSSSPEARLSNQTVRTGLVDWKPEGATSKLLKKKQKLNANEWVALMSKEILVWSGKLRSPEAHKSDVPVFLSRGIIPVSPRGMLNLFWDDSRTRSYNKFSLGRSTSMELENCLAPSVSSPVRATKVVQSETQVPFTGFSVVMSTLMHARQVEDDELEQCYIIVSRSLTPGRAGLHVGNRSIEEGKNELLWGVNILRSVPGHADLTDLTSISQVSSNLVVQFLAQKVGMMAVESCYSAMRSA